MKKFSLILSGLVFLSLNLNGCAALNKQMGDGGDTSSQKVSASSQVGIVDTQKILRSSKLSAILDGARREFVGRSPK